MEPDATVFAAAGAALLRMTAAPASLADATRDPHPDGPLREVLSRPAVREAVEIGSADLAEALMRVDAGPRPDPAALRRAAQACARYLLRIAGRPTPFGLFAGVAPVMFGDSAKVRLGDRHTKRVRPDLGWLIGVVRDLERRPEIRRDLLLVANDLCFVRGDRLVLPYVQRDVDTDAEEVSVRHTAVVRRALAATATPVSGADLARILAETFPRASATAVDGLVDRLVANEILLTDLRPPSTAEDPLAHVMKRLGVDAAAAFAAVADALAEYAELPVGTGLPAFRRAVETMRAVRPSRVPPVQVDLRIDAEVRLPQAVADEAVRAARVLWRLTPYPLEGAHLRQYHRAFLERYGTGRLVPLRELLDPERGLGAPAGYEVPASDRTLEPGGGGVSPRDGALIVLAQRGLFEGGGELLLDDELIDAVAGGPPDRPPPDTVEVCVQVLARSAAALDAGDFRLAATRAVGSTTGGLISGRFTGLVPEAVHPAGDGAGLRAQLVFAPLHPRVTNVAQVPRLYRHMLAIGAYADRADPDVLGTDDLAVHADLDGLRLHSVRHGTPVVAVQPHRLNVTRYAANAVRLIREISSSAYSGPEGWWWGDAALLPRLPRVRYGRTVLSPATWRVSPRLVDPAMSASAWEAALAEWRRRWSVPARVMAGVQDNRLALDLDAEPHRRLLRDQLRRHPESEVTERLSDDGDFGWLDGHANEVVVPVTVTAPPVAVAGGAPARVAEPRRHLPGGEWLYAKLYAGRARHDEILVGDLPLSDVDDWFFIRYADPDPHLRLRVRGDAAVLLPRLHRWAAELVAEGRVNRLVLDTYDPEAARYGGAAALPFAERAFAADSAAVRTQLRLRREGTLALAPDLLVAANHIDLLRSTGHPDWREWLLRRYPRSPEHAGFRAVRRRAMELIAPAATGRGWEAVRALPGGAETLDAWERRRPAVAAYGAALDGQTRDSALAGLLHMHHNRLVGIDPETEVRALAVARGVVEAAVNRERFGR